MATNLDMMRQLYTLLEQNIFFGDRLTSRQFVTTLSPGQFVSTKLKKTSSNDQRAIWKLCNSTMAASFLWKPTVSTISKLYGDILQFKALPHLVLTPTQKQRLKELQKQIKDMQADYEKYQDAWEEADIELSKAIAREADEQDIVRLQRARARALDQWRNTGRKYDYERARGEMWDLIGSDPAIMWDDFQQQFDNFKNDAPTGRYYTTNLSTHPSDWPTAGWAKQTLFTKDVYTHEYSKSTHFDGGASGGWGLWSFGGSYSKDTEFRHETSKTTELKIDLEYLVVSIDRPWLVQDVLDRRFWCWKKGVIDNLLISDGGDVVSDPPTAPRGAMPVLPTHLFIVRNVEMTGAWSEEDKRFYHEVVKASMGGGWGPFSVHGNYSEDTSEKTYSGEFSGTTLKAEQPQILAVAGTLLNPQPYPDPHLAWGPEANLDPPTYPLAAVERAAQIEARYQEAIVRDIQEKLKLKKKPK